MASLTTVYVTVRKEDYEKHQDIFAGADEAKDLDGGLVHMSFYEKQVADFPVCETLLEQSIPYDKEWEPALEHVEGVQHHRIRENGTTWLMEFNGGEQETVSLADALDALEEGRIGQYLEAQKANKTPMPWPEQNEIMERRGEAAKELWALDAKTLAKMITFRCASLAAEANESPRGHIVSPQEMARTVNGLGQRQQIAFLLDNGYLVDEDYDYTRTIAL